MIEIVSTIIKVISKKLELLPLRKSAWIRGELSSNTVPQKNKQLYPPIFFISFPPEIIKGRPR
jgi:hypothetical protein